MGKKSVEVQTIDTVQDKYLLYKTQTKPLGKS